MLEMEKMQGNAVGNVIICFAQMKLKQFAGAAIDSRYSQ